MSDPGLTYAFAGLIGLCLGSFVNTLADRLPAGLSIVGPRSACRDCGRSLAAWEMIPLAGYLALRGRCRTCGAPIGWRTPVVEFTAGVLGLALAIRLGFSPAWAVGLVASMGLLALIVIDWEHGLLPDALTLPLLAAGPLWRWLAKGDPVPSLLGAAVCGGLLLVVRLGYRFLARREGMGGGDPKLAAALGGWLGAAVGLEAVVVGAGVGVIVGLIMILAGRAGWRTALPFGTFLGLSGLGYFVAKPPF